MKNKIIIDSWDKINPKTAARERMLKNIIESNHLESKHTERPKILKWAFLTAGLAVIILALLLPILNRGKIDNNRKLKEPVFLKMAAATDLGNAEIIFDISEKEKEIFGKVYPVYKRQASKFTRDEIFEIFNFTGDPHISRNSLYDTHKDGERTLKFYRDGRIYYTDSKNEERNQAIEFVVDDIWDLAEAYLKERDMLPETYEKRGGTEYWDRDELLELGVSFRPTYNGHRTFGGAGVTVAYNANKDVTGVTFAITPYSYLKDTNTIKYEEAINNFPWENSAIGFEAANIQESKKIVFDHCELQYYDYLLGEDTIQPCFMFTGLIYDASGNSTPIEYAVYAPVK